MVFTVSTGPPHPTYDSHKGINGQFGENHQNSFRAATMLSTVQVYVLLLHQPAC